MGDWLRVRRWREHQHYTDRNPPWIKWKVETLEDDKLNTARTETRLFWSLLLLVAAKKENVIPRDAAWLAREVSMPKRAVTRALNELVQGGLVQEFDSKVACAAADKVASESDRPSRDARSETEVQETETEEPSSQVRSGVSSAPRPDEEDSNEPHEFDAEPSRPLVRFNDNNGLSPIGDEVDALREQWSSS